MLHLILRYRLRRWIQRNRRRKRNVVAPMLVKFVLRAIGPETPGDSLLIICGRFPPNECGGRYKGRERRVQRLGAHDLCVRIDSYDQGHQAVLARHRFESLDVSSVGGSEFTVRKNDDDVHVALLERAVYFLCDGVLERCRFAIRHKRAVYFLSGCTATK